jgi:hypothetical protein
MSLLTLEYERTDHVVVQAVVVMMLNPRLGCLCFPVSLDGALFLRELEVKTGIWYEGNFGRLHQPKSQTPTWSLCQYEISVLERTCL